MDEAVQGRRADADAFIAPGGLAEDVRVVFVGRHRVVWKLLVLYIVTLGISRRVWLYRVNKEIDGHAALGINHKLNLALLALPAFGPFYVQCRTAYHMNHDLRTEAPLAYGPTWALCLAGLVPIAGNGFFLGWSQDRLNRYWTYEKGNPEHGIDIDVGLEDDKSFLVELEAARKESFTAGSRFDRKKRRRQERWRSRVEHLERVREERERVRALGGSTPVIPWKAPEQPEKRQLKVTCTKCETAFQVEQDPYHDTHLECPECGRKDTIPAVYGGGGIQERIVEVDCPQCEHHFKTKAPEEGPVEIRCPECGLHETLQDA